MLDAGALGSASSRADVWLLTLASVVAIGLLSLLGALTFVIRRESLHRVLPYLVSVAAGAMLGSAFLHIVPELPGGLTTRHGLFLLAGIVMFFCFERYIHWHQHGHADDHRSRVAPYAWLNLTGDALHNFVDGLIIAAAYASDVRLGITTTLAVALHEIPQEMGDVGVLLMAKLSRGKVVLLNLATALVAVVGALVGLTLGGRIEGFHPAMLAVTAGGFIYVAAADLIPELHRERRPAASLLQVACLIGGMALMVLLD